MALVECRECVQEISDRATKCPHCGIPFPATNPERNRKILKVIALSILVPILFILILASIGSNNHSKSSDSKSLTSTENEKAPVEISKCRWVNKEYGTRYVTGKVKNNTDKALRYVSVRVPIYDGQGNKIEDAMSNMADLAPNATWKFKAYVMTDDTVSFGSPYIDSAIPY